MCLWERARDCERERESVFAEQTAQTPGCFRSDRHRCWHQMWEDEQPGGARDHRKTICQYTFSKCFLRAGRQAATPTKQQDGRSQWRWNCSIISPTCLIKQHFPSPLSHLRSTRRGHMQPSAWPNGNVQLRKSQGSDWKQRESTSPFSILGVCFKCGFLFS